MFKTFIKAMLEMLTVIGAEKEEQMSNFEPNWELDYGFGMSLMR